MYNNNIIITTKFHNCFLVILIFSSKREEREFHCISWYIEKSGERSIAHTAGHTYHISRSVSREKIYAVLNSYIIYTDSLESFLVELYAPFVNCIFVF